MSAIFEHASVWNPYDVVRIEQRTPRRYDTKGRPIVLDSIQTENGFHDEEKSTPTREKSTGLVTDTREASSTGSH
jgi:hypothetical protein